MACPPRRGVSPNQVQRSLAALLGSVMDYAKKAQLTSLACNAISKAPFMRYPAAAGAE